MKPNNYYVCNKRCEQRIEGGKGRGLSLFVNKDDREITYISVGIYITYIPYHIFPIACNLTSPCKHNSLSDTLPICKMNYKPLDPDVKLNSKHFLFIAIFRFNASFFNKSTRL